METHLFSSRKKCLVILNISSVAYLIVTTSATIYTKKQSTHIYTLKKDGVVDRL